MKVHIYSSLLLCFRLVLSFTVPEDTDYKRQLSAFDPSRHEEFSGLNDDGVIRQYRLSRGQIIREVAHKFSVHMDVARLLFGSWSVERIGHINGVILKRIVTAQPPVMTMTEASRFLPPNWQTFPQLVELLRKIVVEEFRAHVKAHDLLNVHRALGDFSDTRVADFARIIYGEWRRLPVSMLDLCRGLDADQLDVELEGFFRRIMKERAEGIMGQWNNDALTVAFDYFFSDRIEYLRDKLLNDWIDRPATKDELNHGLSMESAGDQRVKEIFRTFRFKTFMAHKIFALEARNVELLGNRQPSSEELLNRKLDLICSDVFYRELIHNYIVAMRQVSILKSVPPESRDLLLWERLEQAKREDTYQEVNRLAPILRWEMKYSQSTGYRRRLFRLSSCMP